MGEAWEGSSDCVIVSVEGVGGDGRTIRMRCVYTSVQGWRKRYKQTMRGQWYAYRVVINSGLELSSRAICNQSWILRGSHRVSIVPAPCGATAGCLCQQLSIISAGLRNPSSSLAHPHPDLASFTRRKLKCYQNISSLDTV